MKAITTGRNPTLGEVLDYYTREDFLTFMLQTLSRYRIVTVISKTMHWEPNWEHDEAKADSLDALRRYIVDKITTSLPDVALDQRPEYYPSFHQSVAHRSVGLRKNDQRDCVFETDLPTWRDSFRDVGAAVTLMEQYNVRYRHKFSGHRSLHIVIPADIVPQGYRGKSTQKLANHIISWGGAHAHPLPQITRMPYSLNEDTGLVCLPIARGELAAFRPWMANPHLVEICDDTWYEDLSETNAANLSAFLDATQDQEPSVNAAYFIPDTVHIARKVRRHANAREWLPFTTENTLPEQSLLESLDTADPDTRWLALEVYLLRGTDLSQTAIHKLLAEDEEYARVSAVDVLLRFEDAVLPTLVQIMENLNTYSIVGAQAAYLLTQSESLRQKILDALVAQTGASYDALLISACLAGAMASDWNGALRILAPLQGAADLTDKHRVQMQALELMRAMGTWSRHDGAIQAQKLAALGSDIVDLVLLAAGSPNRYLRRDLVDALTELADPRSVDLLVTALGDDYSRVRRKAVTALTRISEPAVDALIEALASDQVQVRKHATLCLGHISKNANLAERIKPTVMQMLNDGDERVRRQAIRALTDIIEENDLGQIVQFIREATAWENAQHATEVLAALGDTGLKVLEKLALEEHAFAAAYYIATQGDVRGGDILVELLDDEDAIKRESAMGLLAKLLDPRCVPYLAEQLQTLTHWRTMWYAHKLGEIGTPEAVDGLIAVLDREHKFTHRGAVRGLGIAKDPRAIPHLIQCLGDKDSKTRSEAADALVTIGEASIAPLQAKLAEDTIEARQLRNRIRHTLKRLGVEGS
ncbi:MAG: HEAT repeat domain-containing protein [Anaerolineae bacterium]|nr:HEAT repeat domain-containing protein [Anaerolineae bacterium]